MAFDAALDERRVAYGGLLDDEALALLLLDEEGLNEGALVTLAEARGRAEATVRVEVVRALPVKAFEREGGVGRVANVVVRDATGEASLVLWDRDVEKVDDGTLAPGAMVRVVNARVKDARYGLELVVGAWTALEVEGAPDPAKRKLLLDAAGADPTALGPGPAPTPEPAAPARPLGLADAPVGATGFLGRGRLVAVEPARSFKRRDGTVGFVANASLEDESGRVSLVCWDEAAKAVRAFEAGAFLEATGLSVKERDGRAELHTSRATVLRPYRP